MGIAVLGPPVAGSRSDSPTYALDTACRIVGRGLTREEWRVAFGELPFEDVCG